VEILHQVIARIQIGRYGSLFQREIALPGRNTVQGNGMELVGETKADIIADLTQNGFDVEDMSDDDIAKTHVRYLMGGRVANHGERLYTFEFPEQKGALLKFLETLQNRWNISLFHYRAHGADYGNILAGFQLEQSDVAELESALEKLDYVYQDVTDSKSYRYFLR